jgi:hypothetical protein
VSLTDYQEVTGTLEHWDDWCKAWSARASMHETMGRDALEAGNTISAAHHLETAGVLYHFAKFVFVEHMDQLQTAHKKAVECRNLVLPYLDPPGERVAISYDGGHLYGNLRKPSGVERPPVVVMCMGMDSAKEEMSSNEACISISGPFEFFNLMQERGGHDVFVRRAHCDSEEEALKVAKRVDMTEAAKKITVPLFIVGGSLDTLTPPLHQERLAKEANGDTSLHIFEGGNHCVNNFRYKYSPQSADWMTHHLG